ncbi:MAG: DNA-formamidopyrimidine glycosylase [Acidobacteria bacterium]|nr:DNA-formamidopyrimidine glycosylase [Acidobacteriota bacterium]
MPELPEVETYARYFTRHALHQRIARVRVLDERILGTIRAATFSQRLKGREFTSVRRHGKNLFACAGETWLHLHFGMTGDLAYYRETVKQPRFARVIFDFDGGAHLAYEDMRLFGGVDLTPLPDDYIREHALGPDPLDASFTLRTFRGIANARRGAVKSVLMSQEIIAGVGNLYADEMLFQASIHPRRAINELSDSEVRTVFTALRRVLREAIARRDRDAELPPRYLFNHREEGARCPRCGGTIARSVVFGRTTYFCATHQK